LYWEQQLPKVEPWQVCLPVPAQVPSVETLLAGEVAVAAADVLTVEVAGLAVEVAALEEETAPLPPQLPNPDWQPVPQWSV
jgi:hypothetical protein